MDDGNWTFHTAVYNRKKRKADFVFRVPMEAKSATAYAISAQIKKYSFIRESSSEEIAHWLVTNSDRKIVKVIERTENVYDIFKGCADVA